MMVVNSEDVATVAAMRRARGENVECSTCGMILNEPMEIGKAPLPAEDETLDYNLIITRTVVYSDCAISGAAFTALAAECGFSRDPGETLGVFLRRIERAGHGWVTLLASMAERLTDKSGIPDYTLEWDTRE